ARRRRPRPAFVSAPQAADGRDHRGGPARRSSRWSADGVKTSVPPTLVTMPSRAARAGRQRLAGVCVRTRKRYRKFGCASEQYFGRNQHQPVNKNNAERNGGKNLVRHF